MVELVSRGKPLGYLNLDYRPPRISMFPMSYAERALMRSLKRQVLGQNDSNVSHVGGEVSRNTQTDMSYCYHRCPQHPGVTTPHGGDGKKGKVGKGKEEKDGESSTKKGKGRGKEKQKESDDESDSGAASEDENKKSKGKGKGGKGKEEKLKVEKGEKSKKEQTLPTVSPLLPYPWTAPIYSKVVNSSRYPSAMDKEKPSKEDHKAQPSSFGAALEQAVESGRRADEDYIMRWLTERDGSYVQSALRWLECRDASRFEKLAKLTNELSASNLDGGFGGPQTPSNQKHVSFAGPEMPAPQPSPYGPCYFNKPNTAEQGQVQDNSVFAKNNENSGLRLGHGKGVITNPTHGYVPPSPVLGVDRHPLQPVIGTGGAQIHWSKPATNWPAAPHQPPHTAGPMLQQTQAPAQMAQPAFQRSQNSVQAAQPTFQQSQVPMQATGPAFNPTQTPMAAVQGQGGNLNHPVANENQHPKKWASPFENDNGNANGFNNASNGPQWDSGPSPTPSMHEEAWADQRNDQANSQWNTWANGGNNGANNNGNGSWNQGNQVSFEQNSIKSSNADQLGQW